MDRRSVLRGSAMTALALATLQKGAIAQQQPPRPPQQQPPQPPKPWKELIVGSWSLLVIDGIQADGTKVPLYGPNPKGIAMFGADGHYTLSNMRDVRPKFAANDRLKGTPAEIKSAFESGLSHFGRYTVNEAEKSITLHIEACTYPNWDGTTQKRAVTALVGDDLTWTSSAPATTAGGEVRVDLAWRRSKS